MNPFIVEVYCALCGSKGVAIAGSNPWIEKFYHRDPEVCKQELSKKEKK